MGSESRHRLGVWFHTCSSSEPLSPFTEICYSRSVNFFLHLSVIGFCPVYCLFPYSNSFYGLYFSLIQLPH